MAPSRSQGQTSWLMVDALGLPTGTVQPGLAVEDDQWAKLVDDVRAQRFGDLPVDDGFLEVGRALGAALLQSAVGRAFRESMAAVTAERSWSHLIPYMALRLHQPYDMRFERTGPASGRLTVRGKRALRPAVTTGILEVVAKETVPPSRVAQLRETDELLELDVAWD